MKSVKSALTLSEISCLIHKERISSVSNNHKYFVYSRIRSYTWQSSLVHVGFATAFFLTALLVYLKPSSIPITLEWEYMSLVGFGFGIISLILFYGIYRNDGKHDGGVKKYTDRLQLEKNGSDGITILKETLHGRKTILIFSG